MGLLTAIASGWCGGILVVALRAALGARRRAASVRGAPVPSAPRVLIVRPCAGDERHIRAALTSTAAAARLGDRMRFAIAKSDDAAAPAAGEACDACRAQGQDAEVVVTAAVGPNAKVDQLARVLTRASADWDVAVVVDSDVELSRAVRDALVQALAAPAVGAAWAPPGEVAPETLGDRASAALLDASLHAFVLLADLDRGGMVGKAFAVRREALDGVGGFAALTSYLGEDVELARRLHAAGWTVRPADVVAPSLAAGRATAEIVARLTRWIAVVRRQRPWLLPSYPLLFAASPLLLAISVVAVCRGEPFATGALAAVLATRAASAWVARRASAARGMAPRAVRLVDVALADGVLLLAFVRALAARTTVWRGRALRFHGRLLVQSSGGVPS